MPKRKRDETLNKHETPPFDADEEIDVASSFSRIAEENIFRLAQDLRLRQPAKFAGLGDRYLISLVKSAFVKRYCSLVTIEGEALLNDICRETDQALAEAPLPFRRDPQGTRFGADLPLDQHEEDIPYEAEPPHTSYETDLPPPHHQAGLTQPEDQPILRIYYDADSPAFTELEGPAHEFACEDEFRWNRGNQPELQRYRDRLENGSLSALRYHALPAILSLKKGMPVILVSDLDTDAELLNGSQGEVVDFVNAAETGRPTALATRNLPRNQGSSGVPFLHGRHANLRHERCYTFMTKSGDMPLPIVKFEDGIEAVVYPECIVEEPGDLSYNQSYNEVELSLLIRTQIPLKPGWRAW